MDAAAGLAGGLYWLRVALIPNPSFPLAHPLLPLAAITTLAALLCASNLSPAPPVPRAALLLIGGRHDLATRGRAIFNPR